MVNSSASRGEIVRTNYARVLERIGQSARACGRNPADIRLVVVTKTQPVEVIQAVIAAGAQDLGENYVEEAIPKITALGSRSKLSWHMIGHVQSRKAAEVCEYFQFVHSLDSVKLADRLSRFATASNKNIPVWLELNVGGEASKSGWDIADRESWNNILPDLEKIFGLPNLTFLGVMTVPPYTVDPQEARPYYRRLKEFQQYIIDTLKLSGFTGLSMGMSSDFEIAIEEGSTCLRIGQAILGPRPK